MHNKGLFLTPEQAVGSINSEGASLDLPATARRAVEATLWVGAHYGYGLGGMPADLRQTFIDEVDSVLEVLSNYSVHYPGYDPDEEGPAPKPLSQNQILAVEYHQLRHFLQRAGLEH